MIEPGVIFRKCCRGILITPSKEILLVKISNADGSWVGWITPGGGIDPGETEEQALVRELCEELGVREYALPLKVGNRRHRYQWNDRVMEQDEVFFLVRTEKFDLVSTDTLTPTEKLEIKELRWWKLSDIHPSGEVFAPRELNRLVESLIRDGVPAEPIKIGV